MMIKFKLKFILVLSFLFCIVPCVATTTPIASFSAGENYKTITFTDTSIGTPNCWQWNFGDGSTSTEQNPIHTYSTDGQYTVTLDVGTNGQYLSSTTKTVEAWGLIQGSYSSNVTSGYVPLAVQFTDTSVGNPDYWRWEIGNSPDGNFYATSYEQNPSFVLTQPGRYWLSLSVKKTGSKYGYDKNWGNVITVASPYTGTATATTTTTTTAATTTTTVATSTTSTPTTTTTTAATTTTTVTTSTTSAPTQTNTIVTTKPTMSLTTIQTTVPTVESTPIVITTMPTPTKKMTTKMIPTHYPTATPSPESSIGVEGCLFALCFVGLFLFNKR